VTPSETARVGELRDPFGMLIQRAAEMQGANDVEGFGRSVASGIVAREAWTEPYVNDLARVAWYRESRGLEGGPQNAPASYIEDWKGAFRSGDMSVPGVAEVSDEMRSRGVPTPSDLARAAEVKQVTLDWRANVARLNQNTGASYRNPANAAQMALYACGAASFATAVNAVNPDANLRVDDAMDIINRGGRNLINSSVGLRLGSDLSALAPAFNEAGVAAEARNFTPQTVQQHFATGGGPIVFSGPGWGRAMGVPSVPAHIYTATNADANGVTIVDSSGSNRTRMTWDQWQGATGGPAKGAGISAVPKTVPSPGAAPTSSPTPMTAPAAPPPGATVNAPPSPKANMAPVFAEPDVRSMQDRIVTEMPKFNVPPPGQGTMEDRMRAIRPAAEWLEREYGYPAEVTAGLMMAENGVGAANSPAVRANNLFSLEFNRNDRYTTGVIPAGRFAGYRNPEEAFARKIGIFAHPENTNYNQLWRNRQKGPDAVIDGLIAGRYIVDEPGAGNSVREWRARLNEGRRLYRVANGKER
jgi:hypothetical protein